MGGFSLMNYNLLFLSSLTKSLIMGLKGSLYYEDSYEPIRLKLCPTRGNILILTVCRLVDGGLPETDLNIYITASLALNHRISPENSDQSVQTRGRATYPEVVLLPHSSTSLPSSSLSRQNFSPPGARQAQRIQSRGARQERVTGSPSPTNLRVPKTAAVMVLA